MKLIREESGSNVIIFEEVPSKDIAQVRSIDNILYNLLDKSYINHP